MAERPFHPNCGKLVKCDECVMWEQMERLKDLIPKIPVPTLDELRNRFALNIDEERRVFEEHDPGDECTRPFARFVCSLKSGKECPLRPGHWGPHAYQK